MLQGIPGIAQPRWVAVALVLALSGGHQAVADDFAAQSKFDECEGPRCLGVNVSNELLEAMESDDGATLDDLVDGLRLRYGGEEPVDVRLIVARYQNGRLVRYGVSARSTLEPGDGAVTVRESERAIREALRPVTEREIRLRKRAEELDDRSFRAAAGVFIGSLPPTYLITGDGTGLVAGVQDENGTASARYRGPVGVLVLVPENPDQRGEGEVTSIALMLDLDPIAR